MQLSVIIPTINNATMLLETISVLKRNKPALADLELLVVNQGSDSMRSFLEQEYGVKFIQAGESPVGFAKACNMGLKAATGRVLFLLNDDVIVPPGSIDNMLKCLANWERVTKLGKIGIVGPFSNYVAGVQNIGRVVTPDQIDQVAKEIEQNGPTAWVPSNFVSGFAMMITRECFESVGFFDESFPYGHNDTDYVIRAYEAGYYAGVVGNAFIFHWGSTTLKKWEELGMPDTRMGMASEPEFRAKWKKHEWDKPTHLSVVMRVKITNTAARDLFQRVLMRVDHFADAIFVLDDGSTAKIDKLLKRFSKVVWTYHQNEPLQERRDRNMLVQAAYYWGQKHKPGYNCWIFSIDADEIYEDKVTREYLDRLMRPEDPLVWQYIFHWYTFWNSDTQWRSDGIWGSMYGSRLFKVWGTEPRLVRGNAVGFHVEHVPLMAGAQRITSIRVKHYGYVQNVQRAVKHKWYEAHDTDRQPDLIGASDYSHLVNETGIKLVPWVEDNNIVLTTMVKNEERSIDQWLSKYGPFADDIVLLDTGSTDRTVEFARTHQRVQVFDAKSVKLIDTLVGPCMPFAAARNLMLEKCHTCDAKWILHLDIDEDMSRLPWVRRAIDMQHVAGYMFYVRNYQKGSEPVLSETIRLFYNSPEFYYTGYVHETLDECTRKYKHVIHRAVPRIEHTGFLMSTPEAVQHKFEHYLALELKQIQDYPQDARPYFNIALHLLEDVRFIEEAIGLLEISAELDPGFYNPQKELSLVLVHKAAGYMHNAIGLLPAEHIHKVQMEQIATQLGNIAGDRFAVAPGHVSKFKRHKELLFKLQSIISQHRLGNMGHVAPKAWAHIKPPSQIGQHIFESTPRPAC